MRAIPKRVLVVGASAAGLRCASRLARLEPSWKITVIEQNPRFSYAACGLPYVLSGDIDDADELRRTTYGTLRDASYFASVKGIEVIAPLHVQAIDAEKRLLHAGGDDEERTLEFDELVLATGARPRRLPGQPNHPRVRTFHVLDDLEPILVDLQRSAVRRVAILGGGLNGCELAEAFTALWGVDTIVCEAAPHPLPALLDAETGAMVARVLADQGVTTHLGAPVRSITADHAGVQITVDSRELSADLAVVAIGVDPAVELASSVGVALGPTGAIAVDERLATSVPHIWAAGDCVESVHAPTGAAIHLPLGSLANRQGRTLANVLAGGPDRMPPVSGALAVKIFDHNVASVGVTRARAEQLGIAAQSVWVMSHDAAHYWPEAREIAIALVFADDGRVLGVQAVGAGETAKRVDIAAQVIARRGTIDDLAHIDHAYAPPYAPALDPLAVAAMAAQNRRAGVEPVSPLSPLADHNLLDVRNTDEQQSRPLTAARVQRLPQPELGTANAATLAQTDVVVCERGPRSAEVVRWLAKRDISARYLGGGLRWRELAGLPLE